MSNHIFYLSRDIENKIITFSTIVYKGTSAVILTYANAIKRPNLHSKEVCAKVSSSLYYLSRLPCSDDSLQIDEKLIPENELEWPRNFLNYCILYRTINRELTTSSNINRLLSPKSKSLVEDLSTILGQYMKLEQEYNLKK